MTVTAVESTHRFAPGYYAAVKWPPASRMFQSEPTLERDGVMFAGPFRTLDEAMAIATVEG